MMYCLTGSSVEFNVSYSLSLNVHDIGRGGVYTNTFNALCGKPLAIVLV